MSKWAFNYDSGEYEDISRDGFSWTRGEYTYNWDDSEYCREEEEEEHRQNSLFNDDEDDLFWQRKEYCEYEHYISTIKTI